MEGVSKLSLLAYFSISFLSQDIRLAQAENLLEKLGEVHMSNFLTAMKDLKRRIKAGTEYNF